MVPMPFSDTYAQGDQQRMLRLARDSIEHGLDRGGALPVVLAEFPPALQQKRACFVTLNRHGQLRGCIGHLQAVQSLAKDVADNAYAAAFEDPRFPPFGSEEWDGLDIHISILSDAEPVRFASEADLIQQLRPGEDGLILQEGPHRGTFLPSVWEQLPDPEQFWRHLKGKAGLPAHYWSDSLRLYRYGSFAFGSTVAEIG